MVFQIKRGCHRSRLIPSITTSTKISGKFKLIGDFSYEIQKQKDTNKLFGISDNFHHHIDSVRIGWRSNNVTNLVELMCIRYHKKTRDIFHLCYVETNIFYNFEIEILEDFYRIKIWNKDLDFKVECYCPRESNWSFIRYLLYPYFGGKQSSPKDFEIEIILN